jgi:hypothetical protein
MTELPAAIAEAGVPCGAGSALHRLEQQRRGF